MDFVVGQRVRHLETGETCQVHGVWPRGIYSLTTPGELGVWCDVRGGQLTALEPRWVGRARHYAWRVRFAVHMLRVAVCKFWTPPWRYRGEGPDDLWLDLRTALEVAWVVWK